MRHANEKYNGRIIDRAGIIPEDEPVCLLRGQDKAAPATLRAWADENDRLGGDPVLSYSMREHADLMEAWQKEHVSKLADM
jgi:hypothetical protein